MSTVVFAMMPEEHTIDVMEQFLTRPPTLHPYRAFRRLEASNSRTGTSGWLDAKTEFAPTTGFVYEIVAEGGSGYIRSRVLRSLLEEERLLIARGDSADVALSQANYRFEDRGVDPDGFAQIGMMPLRKEKALIRGTMFLAPADGELVRIEGRLAKNPSFWISKVDVVRSYRRVDGVLLVVALESTAQLRLLGRSTLRMTYEYSSIDNRAVSETDAEGGVPEAVAWPDAPRP